MGVVFSAIAYFVVTAGVAIAAAAIAIASTIIAAVSAIAAAMSSVISGIAATVGQAVAAVQSTVTAAVDITVKAIGNTIIAIGKVINTVAAPILNPIKDALTIINNMMLGIKTYVTTVLAPVQGIIDIVSTVSELLMLVNLIKSLQNMNDLMALLAKQGFITTAQAIAQLYLSIVTTARDTMNIIHETQTAFNDKVLHAEERIRESNRLAIQELRGIVQESEIRLWGEMQGKTTIFERRIEAVQRRTEDLPFFAGMLIRTLH